MSENKIHFDVVIIGGGPAGLSAAMWAEEMGLKALLIERDPEFGGQLHRVYNLIENHLGSDALDGDGLRRRFVEQIAKRGFERKVGAGVTGVDLTNKIVTLAGGEAFRARALIIATGVSRRRLGVAGEAEFKGKGIIESGKMDPGAARGKRVLIVGGGDAAIENALILSEGAVKVTVVHRRAEFRARKEFLDKVKKTNNIEMLTGRTVERIFGGEEIEGVELAEKATGAHETLAVERVLVRIGVEPNSVLFRDDLDVDRAGYIKVDARCETSMEGVFAIGDVANPLSPTVSTAVGTGATAARCVYDYLVHTQQLDR